MDVSSEYLPNYCEYFEQYLGINDDSSPLRCAKCLRKKENYVSAGLAFISGFTSPKISIKDTKEAFLAQKPAFQKMYVEIIKKTGRQIGIHLGEPATPQILSGNLIKSLYDIWKGLDSPEFQEFKDILENADSPFGDMLLTRLENTLLQNLFQVLDKSERAILKGALDSPSLSANFFKEFRAMPKHSNLLKDLRRVLDEYDPKIQKAQEIDKQKRMQSARIKQMQDQAKAKQLQFHHQQQQKIQQKQKKQQKIQPIIQDQIKAKQEQEKQDQEKLRQQQMVHRNRGR